MANPTQIPIPVLLLGLYIPLIVLAQTTPDCRGQKSDIIFLLDSSTSEGHTNFNHQLEFVKNLTRIYHIGPNNVQIGVTTFSTSVYHQFWLNAYHDQASLESAITNIPYISGNTNTGDGINFVTTQGFSSAHGMRSDATHILVVITDGQSQDSVTTAAMADKAHKAGIEVVAIGIGSGVRMSELQAIASDTKHILTVQSFLALASIQHNLAATTCNIPAPIVVTAAPSCNTAQADVVFILDSSGSEGQANFQKQLQFVSNFVTNVQLGPQNIQVGLVTFSDIVKNEFYLNTYHTKQDILAKLQNVPYRGSTTHTDLGLLYARQYQFTSSHGSRPNAKHIAVVLTDGQSHSQSMTLSEASKLKQSGVTVISVGIGTSVSQTEINGIATDSNHVFSVSTFDALHTIQSEFENTACGGPAPPVTECGSTPADIVFVLDSSGSEGASNFNKQLQFMTNFVSNFHIGPQDVQFGLVTFSYTAKNEFYLNTYDNKLDISNKLNSVAYIGSNTHTELGLQYAKEFQFSPAHGARHNAQKIVIVLTDGQSQSRPDTIHQADLLKQMGVKVISIGIGTGISQTELVSMATDQQHVFNVDNFDALHTIQSELKDTACGSGGGGATSLTSPGANTVCRADVVFAIDASSAEGQANFQKSLSFMSEVVNEFPGSPGDVQFGLVTFGSHASLDFELSQYQSKSSLIRAIQGAAYIGGPQTSWVAVHLVHSTALSASGGARHGIKPFVVLITNGPSSSHSAFLRETTSLHQNTGATGIAIGIGSLVYSEELNAFAPNGHNVFRITNADALSGLRHAVHDIICGGTPSGVTTPPPALKTTMTDSFQILPDSYR